jgi:hypothetical protein
VKCAIKLRPNSFPEQDSFQKELPPPLSKQLIAGFLPGKDKHAARSKAILTMSALVGAMSLARAVSDRELSREILNTVGAILKTF